MRHIYFVVIRSSREGEEVLLTDNTWHDTGYAGFPITTRHFASFEEAWNAPNVYGGQHDYESAYHVVAKPLD